MLLVGLGGHPHHNLIGAQHLLLLFALFLLPIILVEGAQFIDEVIWEDDMRHYMHLRSVLV